MSKSKDTRNNNLIKYRDDHPEMSKRAIARVFHISVTRLNYILEEADRRRAK